MTDGTTTIKEWAPRPGAFISKATSNSNQLIISTNDCYIILFLLDAQGRLTENTFHKQLENQIASIALPGLPWNSTSSSAAGGTIAAICTEGDQIIRLFSISTNGFELLALQALQSGLLNSLAFSSEKDPTTGEKGALFLFAGLSNGILVRFTVEGNIIVGFSLTDPRTR